MSDTMLVINPKAGRGNPGVKITKIVNTFSERGIMPEIYLSQDKGDAYRKVKEKAGEYKKIVCYGGDGTLDEVTSGVIKSGFNPTIGYIPAGSTNDFAHSLGLSCTSVRKATADAIEGNEFACDIGSLNGRYFVYVAAFGLFTEVSYKTAQDMKNVLGHAAYIIEGAKSLFDIKTYRLKITVDDEPIEGEFMYGMITNSESVGGIKNITGDNVEFNDGKFEVVLVRKSSNPIETNKIIQSLLSHNPCDLVYMGKASKIEIESESGEVPWTLDGEDGGSHTFAEIINHNKLINIMVPNGNSLVTEEDEDDEEEE